MIGEDQRLVAARVRLAEEVERHCALLSSRVVEAFLNVPRYPFVPVFYRHERELYRPWRGTDDAWLEAVYTDRVLVTEVDGVHAEDAPDDGVHGVATSSSTLPGLMADMLDALDVRAGDRVLEIGTGTGYNAALLCHLAGDRSVTTVDRTERLAAAARERLRGAGFAPAVLRADGAAGYPDRAPFDRIIATCSVRRIPQAWLDQCAPGGLLVAPIDGTLGSGAVVCLTKLPDGRAVGRFLARPAAFMPLRSDGARPLVRPGRVEGRARATDIGARALDDHGFSFWAGLHLPPTVVRRGTVLLDPADGSAAEVRDHPGRPSTVTTAGPQDLWRAVEAAHTAWQHHHRPRREWLSMEVSAGGQRIGHMAPDGTSMWWAR